MGSWRQEWRAGTRVRLYVLVLAGTLKHVVVCGAGYVCMHRTPNCTYTTIMQSHSHWQAHPFPLAHAHMHAVTLTLAGTPIPIGTRPHACSHTHTGRHTHSHWHTPTCMQAHPHLYSEYIFAHIQGCKHRIHQSHNFGANISIYVHTWHVHVLICWLVYVCTSCHA